MSEPTTRELASNRRTWLPILSFVAAGFFIAALYSVHFILCERSTLRFMDEVFVSSDMHANLLWAKGIREQGWLNPHPYHPWNDWMQPIAAYSQSIQWSGGEQIFQMSPLYTYILSLFLPKLFLMRLLQALMSLATCIFLGLFTANIASRSAGWLAFYFAALYSPFYVYSWPFLRDGLAWLITAALLWALSELTKVHWLSSRAVQFAWITGVLLGLGFLARETYFLVLPVVLLTLASLAWQRRRWTIVAHVTIATVLATSPLIIRNWAVKAPILSTSSVLVPTMISGNAAGAHVNELFFPAETRQILFESHGHAFPAFVATVASHPDGLRGWIRLQLAKLLSLFDPYEAPDNLSFYFVARISPVVRFGLRYWMLVPPALAGLFLSIYSKQSAHLWVWALLPILLLSMFVGVPVSRYRQSLAVFFIPLAAYFLGTLYGWLRSHEYRKSIAYGAALVIAWALILGPLSRQPREQYERPAEYIFSARIYHQHGDDEKAMAILTWVRSNFASSPDARH